MADVQSPTGPGVGYVATRSRVGTKSDTPLIETPQSVSVVTRQQLDDQGPTSVREALRYTPGVTPEYRGTGGSRYDTIIYRGFGGGINYDFGYLDGMRLLGNNYAVPQVDRYFLDRVEVVRGPASVLYGSGNPGGLVNLVSKLPTEQPLREMWLGGGSFGRLEGGFDLSGPVDPEKKLLYRVTGVAHTDDTQVRMQKDQRIAIAPAFTWRPDADTTLTVLGKYQNDPDTGYYGFLPSVGTRYPLPDGTRIKRSFFEGSPLFDKFAREQAMIGYQFEHRFNDVWSMRSSLRYMHLETDYRSVYGTGINTTNVANPLITRSSALNLANLEALTADNSVQAIFGTGPLQHKVVAGVDYQQYDYKEVQGFRAQSPISIYYPNYATPIILPTPSSNLRQSLSQLGVYAQDQIKFDRWVLLASIRHDWAETHTRDTLAGSIGNQQDRAASGRIGLLYRFDNGIAPYASYSTSFQPVPGADARRNPFKPNKGEQYEAGIKYEPTWFNGSFSAALFDITQRNVLTTDPTNPNFSIQTGEVQSRGIELEARANLTENFSFIAAYTHLDNKNTKSTVAPGLHPVFIPENTGSVWANYAFRDGPLAGFGISAGVRYVGSSWGNALNTFKVPDYVLMDGAVHYDFGVRFPNMKGWRLAVNGSNLLDERFVASCATASRCFYGPERRILSRLSYRW